MIKRELVIFLIVGLATVLIDFLTYSSLVWINLLSVDLSKGIGFLMGTCFAYFANRMFTFGHKNPATGSAWRFTSLYAITLGINVWVNAFVLHLFDTTTQVIQLAFLMATGISAILNFIGMKWLVFKAKPTQDLL